MSPIQRSPLDRRGARTSFVGRTQELASVKELLSQTRLLTLSGAGGVGKTRLALRVAADLASSFREGVCWVELGALGNAALVAQAVAGALELRESPQQSLVDFISSSLQAKQLLLVLDNCEHLLSAVRQLVEQCLDAAPELRIMATSRQPLGASGEVAWLVPSLSLPPADSAPHGPGAPNAPRGRSNPQELMRFDAVQLFASRAASILPEFVLTAENGPIAAQICCRLDGLPLAIELAAARVRVLSMEQIASRLDDRFALLSAGNRLALIPRHQTLRAALDWSYDLLAASEQKLLGRLAVFAGGFTLDAVESVCRDEMTGERAPNSAPGLPGSDTLDTLSALVDKSLVVAETLGRSEARYHLLETIREYALEKLIGADERNNSGSAHRDYYLGVAERGALELSGAKQAEWLARLNEEHDNLRAALRWSDAEGDDASAVRIALALTRFWENRGHLNEGREWWTTLLRRADKLEPSMRVRALNASALLTWRQSDNDVASALFEESLALARAHGDDSGVATALEGLGELARNRSDYHGAQVRFEESLALYRAPGDRGAVARLLNSLGNVAWERADYATARAHYDASLAIRQELGDKSGVGVSLFNLALVAHREQDYATALPLYRQSLALGRELGNQRMIAYALRSLGEIALEQGDPAAAREPCAESVSIFREAGEQLNLAMALHNLGNVLHALGDDDAAFALYQEAMPLFQQRAYMRGLWISLDDLAGVAQARGQHVRAARLLGAGETLRASAGVPLEPLAGVEHKRMVAGLRLALGRDAFRAAWAHGRGLALDAALSYAREAEEPAVPTAALRIMAFGETRVQRGGHWLSSADWKYAKAKELCYFLLCQGGATKEEIGLALWPDVSAAQLRSTFHRTLYHLRHALGRGDWIVLEEERYAVNGKLAYWFDADEFETKLRAARAASGESPALLGALRLLRAAVELYQGDFLADMPAGDWITLRREALGKHYLQALLELGQHLFAAADYAEAAGIYERAIARDSYQEEAGRAYMRCLARQGRRAQALRHYETLSTLLRAELGVAPEAETAALYERLRRGEEI